MPQMLHVHLLPAQVEPEEMSGDAVVVIDVLRASTTIIHALVAGAKEVIPCLEVAEARAVAAGFPPGEVVLGGERGGLPIEGFDLGNSPTDYTPERLAGRTLVFTTTNGTRAMMRCGLAGRVLLGAPVNAAAVVERLAPMERIHLLCAGTEGRQSTDDVLAAGLFVQRLQRHGGAAYQLNIQALAAWKTWQHAFGPQALGTKPLPPEQLAARLRDSLGGQNLVGLGLDADILTAAQLDRFALVPELSPTTMRIASDRRK